MKRPQRFHQDTPSAQFFLAPEYRYGLGSQQDIPIGRAKGSFEYLY